MRIVVYGGSFNPVHAGHAMIASVVAGREDVDEVWMMVSPQNPFKTDMRLMPEQERLRLVKLVADTAEGIKASDFEFRLSRPSYTYKTLCALRDAYPQHTFRLLVGSDNWRKFRSWRNPDEIVKEFGVLVYQRPDNPVTGPFPEGVELLKDVPVMMVSSSYIRQRLREGKSVRFMVPDVVEKELKENILWKTGLMQE